MVMRLAVVVAVVVLVLALLALLVWTVSPVLGVLIGAAALAAFLVIAVWLDESGREPPDPSQLDGDRF